MKNLINWNPVFSFKNNQILQIVNKLQRSASGPALAQWSVGKARCARKAQYCQKTGKTAVQIAHIYHTLTLGLSLASVSWSRWAWSKLRPLWKLCCLSASGEISVLLLSDIRELEFEFNFNVPLFKLQAEKNDTVVHVKSCKTLRPSNLS